MIFRKDWKYYTALNEKDNIVTNIHHLVITKEKLRFL